MNKATHKTMLVILDGWGLGNHDKSDAISNTPTPYFDSLMKNYPNSQLAASGENVGLPDGQMGNSEVGHLNIGAGRVVYQDLVKINLAIQDGSFFENETMAEAMNTAKTNNKAIHFLGLVSPGGVHSMDSHLVALSQMAGKFNLDKVFIHALTDGRDTDPQSGKGYIKNLLKNIENTPAELASLVGRYYTMDRDKRWERIKVGYDLMLRGKGTPSKDILKSIQESYDHDLTDEFIKPIVMTDERDNPIGNIQEGDVVIAFNFRTDRLRQITQTLTQQNFPEHDMQTIPLHYYTMTRYDEEFKNIHIIYDKENVKNTLGEYLSKNNLKQLRIAETEKYAHVTFFFSGGREEKFPGESRIMVSSPKVATYDLQPEMSAPEVADKLVKELKDETHDFICLNFANGDMVGHTGIYSAIQKAVKTVDSQLEKVVETAKSHNYDVVIIADHGNADNAVNKDGSPNTAHSLNPVPFIVVTERYSTAKNGKLADVAPSILKLINLEIPEEMTGSNLIS
ncbi:MAG: 2,3-bisphosphoglycerate-independent phosphoglycerate mutase [Bacteroidales bacterium]|jgi:2,3-bisphosphoglycerate-independent phosphoglycerate mutase|nr:2,3-bisphosphoglycerate-independent phosphoglycerate mutase [Bacteroidales bacterium]